MIDEFIASRRTRWQQTEKLLQQARRNPRRLAATDVEELGRLYRQVTSDLAIARRDYPRDRVRLYLEQIAGRAHPVLYRREGATWSAFRHFWTHTFPQAFRAAGSYTLISFSLFAVPFLLAFGLTLADPIAGRVILPASPLVDQIERGETWLEVEGEERSLMASFIMTNNIRVAFLAFAGGIAFGLGTVYVLINNGLSIGAVAGLAASFELGDDLLEFVVGHGGIELSVIFVVGGAGLRLGHALLAPGLLSRREALALAARRSVPLVVGCAALLVVAGTIEGFVSPSELPPWAKGTIGLGSTLLMYAYLLLSGRQPAPTSPAPL